MYIYDIIIYEIPNILYAHFRGKQQCNVHGVMNFILGFYSELTRLFHPLMGNHSRYLSLQKFPNPSVWYNYSMVSRQKGPTGHA